MNNEYTQMDRARVLGAYLGDIRVEIVKMARTPAFAIPTILFPLMFYMLFGVVMGGGGDPQRGLYALAGYAVFGTMGPGLFGFGVSLAFEREQGLLTFRQALPAPPGGYLLGRMVNAMLFVSISAALLIILAVTAGHAPLSFGQAIQLFIVNVLGVLPFCALGLFFGTLASGNAAPAIINMVYLPMAFLSGLWVPMQFLPKMIQQMAPLWPAYHLAQLSLSAFDAPSRGSTATHIAALVGITVLAFFIAMRRLGNRGISLLGPGMPQTGRLSPLRRVFSLGLVWVAIGLFIAGVMGGNAPLAAASSAATSKDAADGSSPPVGTTAAPLGVAAPESPVIAEFDAGSANASYGIGFTASDDKMRDGNSSVSQQLVEGGAGQSKAALEVTGEVGTAIQYPFAGTSFLPNGKPQVAFGKQGLMDYSARQTLRFDARGDGQRYMVIIMGPALDAIPAMYGFVAGPEWQEVRVPLHELGGVDLQRVKLISIGTMNPGPFRFEIDGVRVE